MELQTIEEIKMLELAAYSIETYGTASGVTKYNSVCSDLCVAKKCTLEELKASIDNE